jgi:hypothetical protein
MRFYAFLCTFYASSMRFLYRFQTSFAAKTGRFPVKYGSITPRKKIADRSSRCCGDAPQITQTMRHERSVARIKKPEVRRNALTLPSPEGRGGRSRIFVSHYPPSTRNFPLHVRPSCTFLGSSWVHPGFVLGPSCRAKPQENRRIRHVSVREKVFWPRGEKIRRKPDQSHAKTQSTQSQKGKMERLSTMYTTSRTARPPSGRQVRYDAERRNEGWKNEGPCNDICNTHNFRGGNACRKALDANRLLPTPCGDGPMCNSGNKTRRRCTKHRFPAFATKEVCGKILWHSPYKPEAQASGRSVLRSRIRLI